MDSNISGNAGGTAGSANVFYALYSSGQSSAANNHGNGAANVMPHAGTFSNLYIRIANSDATNSQTYAVYVNGVQTALAVTLTTGQTTGNNTANSINYVAGDLVSIIHNAAGTTVNQGAVSWTLKDTAAANVSSMLAASQAGISGTVTSYISPMGVGSDNTGTSGIGGIMPTSGTVKNAYVDLSAAVAAAKTRTFTLYQNGIATLLVVTITNASTGNNTTNSVTVAAGDLLYWVCAEVGSPSAANTAISAEFDPDINGESVLMLGSNTGVSTSVSRFQIMTGSAAATSTTESAQYSLSQAVTYRNLFVQLLTAPGAAKSWTFQPSVNATPGGPSVTITGAATTTGNDTSNTIAATVGQTIDMKMTPAGTPTAPGEYYWGIVSFIQPPSTGVSASTLMMMGVG